MLLAHKKDRKGRKKYDTLTQTRQGRKTSPQLHYLSQKHKEEESRTEEKEQDNREEEHTDDEEDHAKDEEEKDRDEEDKNVDEKDENEDEEDENEEVIVDPPTRTQAPVPDAINESIS